MHGHPLRHALGCLAVLASLGGCAAASDNGGADTFLPARPWFEGGQTGALMPSCGLTAAARGGKSIPGGDGGIVVNLKDCAGLAMADLELFDSQGTMVEFDLQPLPGGATLLRPKLPLTPGTYDLRIAGQSMPSVVSDEPAMLPMKLGTIEQAGVACGANFELQLDDAVIPYLPQLKLSVAVDGGAEQTWFDYGALDVKDGSTELSLRKCFPSCLSDGTHRLEVTAELAGELGTLEPLDSDFSIACMAPAQAMSAQPRACSASGPRYEPGLEPPLVAALLSAIAAWLAWRRKHCRKRRAFG